MLLPKLIVTIGFQFRESTRALDCRCREAWFSQRKARDFAPESSACSLLSQVFSSGSCGCCSTAGQHRRRMLFLCCREGGSCFLWQLRRRGSFQTGCLLARVLLASGPQRAARFFYHGKLTRRPGAAEEPYSAHMLIRRGYSLFLLCKKERKELSRSSLLGF